MKLQAFIQFPLTRLAGVAIGATVLFGCAYDATGVPPVPTLIFEYSLAGPITESNNLAYYFVLNNSPDTTKVPYVNGPAPLTYPYPDPRNYLPFVRDESDLLDRQPIPVPSTYWSDYFALYQEGGQMVMWQGRTRSDGTINEKYRQLQQGREWGLMDNNKTVQITLPLDQISQPAGAASDSPRLGTIEANLAVATRNYNGSGPQGYLIDRWGGTTQNQFFTLDTTKTTTQDLYNTVAGLAFPQNLAGLDPNSVNLVALHYHVVVQ